MILDSVAELSRPPGWVEVQLPVSSDRWLAKLLIRLGPDAELVGDPSPAVELARRVLDSYRDGDDRGTVERT